jgi:hypothetical protein
MQLRSWHALSAAAVALNRGVSELGLFAIVQHADARHRRHPHPLEAGLGAATAAVVGLRERADVGGRRAPHTPGVWPPSRPSHGWEPSDPPSKVGSSNTQLLYQIDTSHPNRGTS